MGRWRILAARTPPSPRIPDEGTEELRGGKKIAGSPKRKLPSIDSKNETYPVTQTGVDSSAVSIIVTIPKEEISKPRTCS